MATQLTEGAVRMGLHTAVLCLTVVKVKTKKSGNTRALSQSRVGAMKHSAVDSNRSQAVSLSPYKRARGLLGQGLRFDNPSFRHRRVFSDQWRNPASKLDYSDMARGLAKQPFLFSGSATLSKQASPGRPAKQSPVRSPVLENRDASRSHLCPPAAVGGGTWGGAEGDDEAYSALRLAKTDGLLPCNLGHSHLHVPPSQGPPAARQANPAAPLFVYAPRDPTPPPGRRGGTDYELTGEGGGDRARMEGESEEAYEQERALR